MIGPNASHDAIFPSQNWVTSIWYFPIFEVVCAVENIWRTNTINSFWSKNMLRSIVVLGHYLFLKVQRLFSLSVALGKLFTSQNSEQIMSLDKYASISLRQMEANVYTSPNCTDGKIESQHIQHDMIIWNQETNQASAFFLNNSCWPCGSKPPVYRRARWQFFCLANYSSVFDLRGQICVKAQVQLFWETGTQRNIKWRILWECDNSFCWDLWKSNQEQNLCFPLQLCCHRLQWTSHRKSYCNCSESL